MKYSSFESLSIGNKVVIGISSILVLFLVMSAIFVSSLDRLRDDYLEVDVNRELTTTIFTIEKNISEIQREALVYSQTGKASSINRMDSIFKEVLEQINRLDDNTSVLEQEREKKKLIESLKNVIADYGVNIKNLKNRYEILQKILKEDLPHQKDLGYQFLQYHVETAKTNKERALYQKMMQLWLESYLAINSFIIERRFTLKQQVQKQIIEIQKLNNLLLSQKLIKDNYHEEFSSTINEYRKTFEKAVQANRIYLSLVNVVMAGASLELSTLAEKIKQSQVRDFKNFIKRAEHESQNNLKVVIVVFVGILLLFFAQVLFFKRNIADAIVILTETFNSYLKGDFSKKVPDLDRRDEIGALSRAANEFRMLNENLKKANSVAEEAYRIKSDFLANMSHEIRTPMNGIIGMISVLQETDLSSEQKEMLKMISISGNGLLTVLNDILDLSKVESGKFELESHPFDLEKALVNLEFLFHSVAVEKGIEFQVICDFKDLPKVYIGDVTRLKQILINLCSNAIKFTEEGKVSLKVEITTHLKRYKVLFLVEDTGIGIESENLDKLFRAFTQADTSITRKFGGTGLGLAISSKLAQCMNSEINVESSLGVGSCFWFSVFLEEGEIVESESNILTSAEAKDAKVLVVEDNQMNYFVIKKMLDKLGHNFVYARNGLEAVEKASKQEFDIIFLDMQMPVMDGIEATKKIREFDTEVKIVALTANVLEQDRKLCYEVGMDDFLTKPIKLGELSKFLASNSKKLA